MPDFIIFIYEHSPHFSVLLFGVVMAMATQSGSSNSRVSRFELIQKDISYIHEIIERMEGKLDKVTGDHEDRIRTLEHDQGTLNERMKIASGLQAGLALVLSVIAAWFGVQK